ncbi:hypothetical protein CLIM01_00401 [Colletotrichum limetticola]|uniref:Uncharacterized protein n=1 Tax=Colletotrichum limetticola TaxID=1209924 RepID=A0ABQ9QF37_9PEZI|nr:hypothetical protein CLIM01_00401 [Colletotrichum limetticola]
MVRQVEKSWRRQWTRKARAGTGCGIPAGLTATREPELEPTPSGEICLADWSAAFTEANNDFGYVAFKHDDLCGHDWVRVDDFKIDGTCDLAQNKFRVSFALCG